MHLLLRTDPLSIRTPAAIHSWPAVVIAAFAAAESPHSAESVSCIVCHKVCRVKGEARTSVIKHIGEISFVSMHALRARAKMQVQLARFRANNCDAQKSCEPVHCPSGLTLPKPSTLTVLNSQPQTHRVSTRIESRPPLPQQAQLHRPCACLLSYLGCRSTESFLLGGRCHGLVGDGSHT